jgi:hypothetical protein
MAMKRSLTQLLAGLKYLPNRSPGMAFVGNAGEAFAEVALGTTTVILLKNSEEERVFLTEKELVVVPAGVWHRFEGSERLKVLTITPQPTDFRLDAPDA